MIGLPSYAIPRPPPRSTCSSTTPSSRRPTPRAGRAAQRLQRRDLRSDVDVHADNLQVLHVAAGAINPARLLQRHAELVRLEAGGDVRVALRIDVRIDAHGDARRRSLRTRDRRD